MPLLELRPEGIACPAGGFFIDPWGPCGQAIITHGHSDHARPGMGLYICTPATAPILRRRIGASIRVRALAYGEEAVVNGVRVSLHPAGHIFGSAQVRVEHRGEVWAVSGDYKTEGDATSSAFEPIRCHGFITETTFGLPLYRWRPQSEVFTEINGWWEANRKAGRASVLFGYALGKAQRLIAGVDPSLGPIAVHGAVAEMNEACAEGGLALPPTLRVSDAEKGMDWSQALIIAPPSAQDTPWMRRFGEASTAFASGWMAVRGQRRRRSVERGFVLSDHVDWPALIGAVRATGAEQVWTTHGYDAAAARYLREEMGLDARPISGLRPASRPIGGENPDGDGD